MQGVDLRKQSSASWMRFLKNWEVKLIFISSNRISKLSGQQMLPRGGRVISGPRGCVRPGCVFLGRFNNQRTSEIRWTHHSDRAGDHATSPCSLKRGWLEPLLRDGLSHRFPDIYCGHLCPVAHGAAESGEKSQRDTQRGHRRHQGDARIDRDRGEDVAIFFGSFGWVFFSPFSVGFRRSVATGLM